MCRWVRHLVAVLVAVALVSCGASQSDSDDPEQLAPEGEPVDLVYFSDSGGQGVPERYGDLAAEALGREVRVHDYVASGLAAVKVLEYVRGGLAEKVAEAEIIVVYGTFGGVELELPQPDIYTCISTSGEARTPPAVSASEDWAPYREVLDEVYAEIWALRDGQPTVLRAVDIYAPVIGPWREAGIEAECTANWEVWSQVMEASAQANGATFVSVYDRFNGPDHTEDPREQGLIGIDGEHTTGDGAAAIAEALADVGFEPSVAPG